METYLITRALGVDAPYLVCKDGRDYNITNTLYPRHLVPVCAFAWHTSPLYIAAMACMLDMTLLKDTALATII